MARERLPLLIKYQPTNIMRCCSEPSSEQKDPWRKVVNEHMPLLRMERIRRAPIADSTPRAVSWLVGFLRNEPAERKLDANHPPRRGEISLRVEQGRSSHSGLEARSATRRGIHRQRPHTRYSAGAQSHSRPFTQVSTLGMTVVIGGVCVPPFSKWARKSKLKV